MRRFFYSLLTFVALSLIAAGGRLALAQSATVEFDVTVTAKGGARVTDLKKEELQIQDDGKKVVITELTAVSLDGAPDKGRDIVIILDDAGVPMTGTPAIQQLASIFASYAGPGDTVNVVRFHNPTDELVKDRQIALARIAAFSAGSVPYVAGETDTDLMKLVMKLSETMTKSSPHRRKAIICIGSPAVCNPLERDSAAPRDEYPTWVNAQAVTARTNVILYAVIPARVQLMGAGLVDRTGGVVFAGLDNYTPALERVYGDISQYYMATYTAEATKKDLRTMVVRTSRKDTTVKSRDKRGK